MKRGEPIIEIDELVLTGNPEQRAIEVAVSRALRLAAFRDAFRGDQAVARTARETASAVTALQQGGAK